MVRRLRQLPNTIDGSLIDATNRMPSWFVCSAVSGNGNVFYRRVAQSVLIIASLSVCVCVCLCRGVRMGAHCIDLRALWHCGVMLATDGKHILLVLVRGCPVGDLPDLAYLVIATDRSRAVPQTTLIVSFLATGCITALTISLRGSSSLTHLDDDGHRE